jgi:hypothetical protein
MTTETEKEPKQKYAQITVDMCQVDPEIVSEMQRAKACQFKLVKAGQQFRLVMQLVKPIEDERKIITIDA